MGVRVYDREGYGTHHNADRWCLGPQGELTVVDAEGWVIAVYAPGGWLWVRYYTKPAPDPRNKKRRVDAEHNRIYE